MYRNLSCTIVFNHAEESLQDGSHLYSTQHSTASTFVCHSITRIFLLTLYSSSVRAMVNLEGMDDFLLHKFQSRVNVEFL